jgi:hypothetical protein
MTLIVLDIYEHFWQRRDGLDHRVGHCGVLPMTVESMGGNAHTQ